MTHSIKFSFIFGNSQFGIYNGHLSANSLQIDYGGHDVHLNATLTENSFDFAEFFESVSGEAIPNGTSVTLEGDKIKPCGSDETPIGVISATAGIRMDGAPMDWKYKYLTDELGGRIMEDFTMTKWNDENGREHYYTTDEIPEDVDVPSDAVIISEDSPVIGGEKVKFQRPKINPDWDSERDYVSRKNRPEWNIVGLIGKVHITKGQPVASNLIKMKDVSDTVEMWLVK